MNPPISFFSPGPPDFRSAAVLPPLLRWNERDLLDRIVRVVDAGTLKAEASLEEAPFQSSIKEI